MGKFIIKHIYNTKPQMKACIESKENKITEDKVENIEVMTTSEKIEMAQEVLNNYTPSTAKRIKKDKGLIEKAESSKIILTEDNKELLKD